MYVYEGENWRQACLSRCRHIWKMKTPAEPAQASHSSSNVCARYCWSLDQEPLNNCRESGQVQINHCKSHLVWFSEPLGQMCEHLKDCIWFSSLEQQGHLPIPARWCCSLRNCSCCWRPVGYSSLWGKFNTCHTSSNQNNNTLRFELWSIVVLTWLWFQVNFIKSTVSDITNPPKPQVLADD